MKKKKKNGYQVHKMSFPTDERIEKFISEGITLLYFLERAFIREEFIAFAVEHFKKTPEEADILFFRLLDHKPITYYLILVRDETISAWYTTMTVTCTSLANIKCLFITSLHYDDVRPDDYRGQPYIYDMYIPKEVKTRKRRKKAIDKKK